MKKLPAVVRWLSAQEGGRQQPPSGVGPRPYITVVRFLDEGELGTLPVVWSLVVEKVRELGGPDEWLAVAHDLVPEAPHDSLRAGRGFELDEGAKCVARGRTLSERGLKELGVSAAASA